MKKFIWYGCWFVIVMASFSIDSIRIKDGTFEWNVLNGLAYAIKAIGCIYLIRKVEETFND